jgi:hypothetical protein
MLEELYNNRSVEVFLLSGCGLVGKLAERLPSRQVITVLLIPVRKVESFQPIF